MMICLRAKLVWAFSAAVLKARNVGRSTWASMLMTITGARIFQMIEKSDRARSVRGMDQLT